MYRNVWIQRMLIEWSSRWSRIVCCVASKRKICRTYCRLSRFMIKKWIRCRVWCRSRLKVRLLWRRSIFSLENCNWRNKKYWGSKGRQDRDTNLLLISTVWFWMRKKWKRITFLGYLRKGLWGKWLKKSRRKKLLWIGWRLQLSLVESICRQFIKPNVLTCFLLMVWVEGLILS